MYSLTLLIATLAIVCQSSTVLPVKTFANGAIRRSLLACPAGLTMNDHGICCNDEGLCCPDIPDGICCETNDSDMCCPNGMTFEDGAFDPQCCDGKRCCPIGGFELQANGQCCKASGICCEVDGDGCTCQNGNALRVLAGASPSSPNGCGPSTWSDELLEFSDRVTRIWKQSCFEHDQCYTTCGVKQSQCDQEWEDAADDECEEYYEDSWFSWIKTKLCQQASGAVHRFINPAGGNLGGNAFRIAQQEQCTC